MQDLHRIVRLNKTYMEIASHQKTTLLWQILKLGYPRFVDSGELQFDTAAVSVTNDGRLLFHWCRKFFDALPLEGIAYVIAHEVLHVILDHCSRRGNRDPYVWNVAADIMVDTILRMHYIQIRPPEMLRNRETAVKHKLRVYDVWTNHTIESLYDYLLDKGVKPNAKGNNTNGNEENNADDMPKTCGVDSHEMWDSIAGNHGGAVREKIRKFVNEKSKSTERQNRFSGLGSCKEFAKLANLGVMQFPWQQLLRNRLASVRKPSEGENWARCHRKMYLTYPDFLLPGAHENEQETSNILVTIDTSGSMSETAISELVSIVKSLPQDLYQVELTWFDDGVYKMDSFDEAVGRGGTSFQKIEAVADGKLTIAGNTKPLARYPDVVVAMTDGLAATPKLKHPERWIWIITKNGVTRMIDKLGSTVWKLDS